MSKFYTNGKGIRLVGIFIILMMLCTGIVAAADRGVGSQKSNMKLMFAIQSDGEGPLVTTPSADATALAQSLVGSGVTISDAVLTGAGCAGTFTGGGTEPTGIIGFEDGLILSSGDIAFVVGPNQFDDISLDRDQPGDVDLNTLVPQEAGTLDACVLTFNFVPQTNVVNFEYVFSSDEYNEYANTEFNDVFGFFVNGQNVALIPGTSTPVAINNVNMGNPGTGTANTVNPDPTPHNVQFYRNNDLQDGGPFIDTEMDGLTTVFTATANVNPGESNTMKMAVADTADHIYDSNVFIRGSSLISTALYLTPLDATNPVGTTHTVTATYTDSTGAHPSGIPVTITVNTGPNAGTTGTADTDANGQVQFTYTGNNPGTDTITATIDNSETITSNEVTKSWISGAKVPEFPSALLPAIMIIGLLGAVLFIQRTKEH